MPSRDAKPEAQALGRHLTDIVSGLRRWVAAERSRRQAIAEIADLEQRHLLDKVLLDLSLTRDDLDAIVNADTQAPPRLEAMAARLGVAEKIAEMPGRWSHDLALVCKTCPRPEECDRWMQSGASEGFERFCDNARMLEALRKEV